VQDLPDDPDGGDDEADLSSIDDVRTAISALSQADMARLLKMARWFAPRCGELPQDLLQEALTRAWAGQRRCRRGTSAMNFIAGIMRSLTSQELEARRAGTRPELVAEYDDQARSVWGEAVSPEHAVLSRIDDGAVFQEVDAAIADDEQLQFLIEGLCDGMRGKALEEFVGVDTKGLAAARKKLQRRLAARFPERNV
jgi:DNA-directed RNA polymerase specialized sigma24 family protein